MTENKKVEIAKSVTKFVVATSVGMVASRTVKFYVPTKGVIDEIQVVVGAYTLAGMLSDRAVDWVDSRFNRTLAMIHELEYAMHDSTDQ